MISQGIRGAMMIRQGVCGAESISQGIRGVVMISQEVWVAVLIIQGLLGGVISPVYMAKPNDACCSRRKGFSNATPMLSASQKKRTCLYTHEITRGLH